MKIPPNDLVGEDCPLKKLPSTFPTEIDDDLALGLDIGVGSCGQALVTDIETSEVPIRDIPKFPARIRFLGVRAFDLPETHEKTGIKLKNPERRNKRHLRVTTRRRAARMWSVRRLLKKHGLLPEDYPTNERIWKYTSRDENENLDRWRDWHSQMTGGDTGQEGPWIWRVRALDEKLEPLEFAAVLLHLAKHRGFKSNRKSESADSDGGKVLRALKKNDTMMRDKDYRTIGEMFLRDPDFAHKKRNSSGNYTAMMLRKHQEEEAGLIFQHQRNHGNTLASEELENAFLELFNKQLPLQNSINLLGDCPFEEGEKRSSRLAPSFELNRALQKLNNLTLILPSGETIRLADHVNACEGGYEGFINSFSSFQGTKSNPGRITWKDLRGIFNLADDIKFHDLPTPKKTEKKNGTITIQAESSLEGEDFLTRSSANDTARGSYLLRSAIGDELYLRLIRDSPEQLDHAAHALTFFEEIENDHSSEEFWGVINQMEHVGLDPELIAAVKNDLQSESPTLHKFAGTSSMSTLACRKLNTLLEKGTIYPEACTQLYGDHRKSDYSFENITNPIVKSVLRECLKQVICLINETGKLPGRICVELSRDLGKSVDERNEITDGISTRTKNKNANRDNLAKEIGRKPDDVELLRYELWREQADLCPYCGESLSGDLSKVANSNEFQIDHILPRSRSHDNSYDNKVLVHTKCNQHKGNSTPFEFHEIGNGDKDSPGWFKFTKQVESMKGIRKHKRRHLLNTTFAEDENKFAGRHLNDTRYISRLVTHFLQEIYVLAGEKRLTDKGAKRRVFTQPGQLTSIVRKAWGLEDLKKDRDGKRLGDKHHAIDALICALLSEGQRQFITRREQNKHNAARQAFKDITESYRKMEMENRYSRVPCNVRPPWAGFRQDVLDALDLFTVSRRENRKGRGALHVDTIYRKETENDQTICYSRKSITAKDSKGKMIFSKLSALDKIKDIKHERNKWLKKALSDWIKAGSPIEENQLPRGPKPKPEKLKEGEHPDGPIIRRVTLTAGKKSGRKYPQGYVTGGDQVRLDVFSKTNAKGVKKYSLVPVYAYHLSGETPPDKAIIANKSEDQWEQITNEHQFEFSLWKNSRVEIKKAPSKKKPEGEHLIGLYQGVNRNTGAIALSNPEDSSDHYAASPKQGTLLFRKIETDRLGREYVIKKEKRTWRGKTVS